MCAMVQEGSIRLIELQAVPRSLSTALGRCLNESAAASVFLNEPFRRKPDEGASDVTPVAIAEPWSHNDVDIAAAHIIAAVRPVLCTGTAPAIVVSKNLARYLSGPVFRTWSDACATVVWCIRDPRVQISSLLTRTANDLLFGIGSDRLTQSNLGSSELALATDFLQNSKASKNFSRTGWQAIGEHFTDSVGRRPNFVADASAFSAGPERFLHHLCDLLSLEFSPHMIEGWRQPFLNVDLLYDPELPAPDDAWVERAAISRGFAAKSRAPLPDSVLPAAMWTHLVEVAIPTYEMMVRAFNSQAGDA
jgi:hypothetical protein